MTSELEAARQARLDDIARLGDLDDSQVDYLARVDEIDDGPELACEDDVPKLTDDEWAFVIEVNR